MAKGERRIDRLAEDLAARGDDAQRLALVERARRFKRSWVEMAEALVHVRKTRAYERWGYPDLHTYCDQELMIRKATVDKLTGSYMALRTHAPAVLQRDGVAKSIPSVDAVDYFARALEHRPSNDDSAEAEPPAEEVVESLRRAVFDDVKPVAILRREFNPLLHPKPEGAAELEVMEKTRSAARRIQNLVQSIDGLPAKRVSEVHATLERLARDLDGLIDEARARVHPRRAAS